MGRPLAYATCLGCGKRGYYSKGTAKKEMRAKGMHGMSVYRCKTSPTVLWHWGHLPPSVKEGRLARGDLGYTAPRRPTRKRGLPGE